MGRNLFKRISLILFSHFKFKQFCFYINALLNDSTSSLLYFPLKKHGSIGEEQSLIPLIQILSFF